MHPGRRHRRPRRLRSHENSCSGLPINSLLLRRARTSLLLADECARLGTDLSTTSAGSAAIGFRPFGLIRTPETRSVALRDFAIAVPHDVALSAVSSARIRHGFGIGIAHGFATLGTIGFEGRFDYAAIGTVSNVASRLCDEAKPGQILISPRVLTKVKNAVEVEPVGEFELKGIRRPLAARPTRITRRRLNADNVATASPLTALSFRRLR